MRALNPLPAVVVVVLLGCLSVVSAQTTGPTYEQAMGIGLETLDYPHPVEFLTLDVQGERVRMAYMDVRPEGEARGTVTLFHGKNFWGGYWENVIEALVGAGYRVVVPDQVGFGKSSKPDLYYSFDLLARNTAKLLDELGVEKTALVGHSMGGMLAVRFARTYPERVTKLVLENPIGLEDWRVKGVPPVPFETLYERELKQTGAGVREYFKNAYFAHTAWEPRYEQLVEPHARVALSGEYPRWARASALTYLMVYQQPVRHEFHLIEVPTLLVIGQEDRTALGKNEVSEEVRKTLGRYPELGREAAEDIPDAELVELEDVGHIPHIEAPQRFIEPLLEFLE